MRSRAADAGQPTTYPQQFGYLWSIYQLIGIGEKTAKAKAADQFNIAPARQNKIVVTRLDQKRED